MGPRSEERGNGRTITSTPNVYRCFNGAALRGARKRTTQEPADAAKTRFNGAALRGARKRAPISPSTRPLVASMGPRSEERGNGHRRRALVELERASMGPRSEERGNQRLQIRVVHCTLALQWGRAPRSAETSTLLTSGGRGQSASMGPRSEERGNSLTPGEPSTKGCRFNGAALRGARKQADNTHP